MEIRAQGEEEDGWIGPSERLFAAGSEEVPASERQPKR